MQRLPVESSDLVSVGYDVKARILEIEFKEDRVYQYFDVSPDVQERFMRADSYGEFFFAYINKQYRYEKVGKEILSSSEALAFVTANARKIRDLQTACEPYGIVVEPLDLPVEEIQSHDPEKIAVQKARSAYKLAERPVLVNDSFWNILALRGFPGGYMSYVADWLRAEDFLALMADKKDRTISCTDTLVYFDGKRSKTFSRDVWGTLASEPRGKGMSLDTLLVLNGQTKTVAEINDTDGTSSIDIQDSIWHDFAKWYNLQRRLSKV